MVQDLLSIKEASKWATKYLKRPVTTSNISYLIQYVRVKKYFDKSNIHVSRGELEVYYKKNILTKENDWRKNLGDDLNWDLSFSHLKESETTKHVHRLHPYKGKFIPQLVEYFLNSKLTDYKKEIFFKKGDIVLDPFMGSGTTLVQANEIGINSVGIDISKFNCLISRIKLEKYDIQKLENELNFFLESFLIFSSKTFSEEFEEDFKKLLSKFNEIFFPSLVFKRKVLNNEIGEKEYSDKKFNQFFKQNEKSIKNLFLNYGIIDIGEVSFCSRWFCKRIKRELFFCVNFIETLKDDRIKNVLKVIISRTARSCRATKHEDLATLKNPQIFPYYCRKHKKICYPVNSIKKHLSRYVFDTLRRLKEYNDLKKDANFEVINSDSRTCDVLKELSVKNKNLYKILKNGKLDGVFTSPPYLGQIDYHEQHAYAYDLFGIKRRDELEIGPLCKGKSLKAKREYVMGVSDVLKNIKKFVKEEGHFFIVANDKFNLYPEIAERSGLKIVDKFKRPVLNRTEKDKNPYSEIIFHMEFS